MQSFSIVNGTPFDSAQQRWSPPALIGQSPAILSIRQQIQNLGPTDVDVLIHGATGTGKEVVARHLHIASGRSGPFVAINCAALPESLFETEIFGHELGAFTGAHKRRTGKLEHAAGGTVFLDEIEGMPLPLQVKLLRVLQERNLERLGSNEAIAIDCRFIAATKEDLLDLSKKGRFREDLYYRINVAALHLPRLAQRRDDVPLLLKQFFAEASARYKRETPAWTPTQMSAWTAQEWPGNVRELRNFADRWVLGISEQELAKHAQLEPLGTGWASLPTQLANFERAIIVEALSANHGNVAVAADKLGLPKNTLYDKIHRLQIIVTKE